MTIWGAYRLSSNHQAYFETVETLYETGQAVNLDNSLTADKLSSLLHNRGYIDKKDDCDFLAAFVVDSILKKRGKIPNLGELNQLKNYIPEAIIDSTGRCTYLSTRLKEMHSNLGLDAEAQECYLTHRTITSNGEGTVRLEVDIENDKNLSAPVNDILVRLRRHTVDSLSQGENVETIACQWTDAQGKVVFHVDDKSFYSVIPIKQGYEYGVPKGTRDGFPFSKDTRLTFKQRLNKIKVFDSYTYRNIKDDNAFTVRTPSQFRDTLYFCVLGIIVSWWLAFLFVRLTDLRRQRRMGIPCTSDYGLLLIVMVLDCLCILMMFGINDPLKDMLNGEAMTMGSVIGLVGLCAVSAVNFLKFFHGESKVQCGFMQFDFIIQPLQWLGKKTGWKLLTKIPDGFGYLLIAMLLVVLLRLFGTGPEGSDARVNLWGFQPSELSKFLVVFFIAAFFCNNARRIQDFSSRIELFPLQVKNVLFAVICIVALLFMYLLLIKDMGPALVFLVTFILLYSVVRRDLVQLVIGVVTYFMVLLVARWLSTLLGGGSFSLFVEILLPIMWFIGWIGYFWLAKRKIYESAIFFNLLFFLFGFTDILLNKFGLPILQRLANRMAMSGDGVWDNAVRGGDQVAQGIWGLAAGGWFGQGLGMGHANCIPAYHTDMVFQSVGETLGFVALVLIIGCYFFLILRSLRLARKVGHPFLFFAISGIALVTSVQFMVIVLGSLGLIPLTGVSVPFLSYGKAGIIVNLIAFGIVLSMSRHTASQRQREAVRAYDNVLVAGMASFLVVSACITCVLFYYQKLRQNTFLVKPAAIVDASGKRTFAYNPRIALLVRKMHMGDIIDRNGLLLATSTPSRLREQMDLLEEHGLQRNQLEETALKHLTRYYPFGDDLFFMLGDFNSKLMWGNTDNASHAAGYFAEERHLGALRGFKNEGKLDTLYCDNFRVSPFMPGEKDTVYQVMRDYGVDIILKGLKYGADSKYIKEWNSKQNVEKRSIQLTIDAALQKSLQDQLALQMRYLFKKEGEDSIYLRASLVVLDAQRGDLLCSANWPLANPTQLKSMNIINYKEQKGQKAFVDRDLGLTYQTQPGSTAKTVSAMAAYMRDGMQAKNINFNISESEIIGLDKSGMYDIREALRHSTNAFFVKLVNDGEGLYDYLKTIYYNVGIGVNLDKYMDANPSYNTPYFLFPEQLSTTESDFERVMRITGRIAHQEYNRKSFKTNNFYCAMAWGQGNMQASPLNMARAYSVIANRGCFTATRYLMNEQPKQVNILEEDCAKILRENLTYTANNHDGITISSFSGKTGTPERVASREIFSKFRRIIDKENGIKNDSWYVFLIHSPRLNSDLAVALRIERTYERSSEARDWVKDVIVPILREQGYVEKTK